MLDVSCMKEVATYKNLDVWIESRKLVNEIYAMETQLIIASDLGYVNDEIFERNLADITSCKRLINGLIRYHESKASNI